MTNTSRISCLLSAIVVSSGFALAPAAFAQDKMTKDTMSHDTMSKDAMKRDDAMSHDAMKKDDAMPCERQHGQGWYEKGRDEEVSNFFIPRRSSRLRWRQARSAPDGLALGLIHRCSTNSVNKLPSYARSAAWASPLTTTSHGGPGQ